MPTHIPPVAALAALLTVSPAWSGGSSNERVSRSRLCPTDAPEGVRLPPRAGCAEPEPRARRDADGFRDVGGVKLRIGGRAGADFDARR